MTTQDILQHLKEERDRLSHAIVALEGISTDSNGKRPYRRRAGKRVMSAEARAKIAAAARARWAKAKRSGKSSLAS